MIEFGKKLKELREEKELSQKDLAKIFFVAQRTIHAWENNLQEPSMKTICELAKFFEVTTDELMNFDNYSYNFEYQGNGTKLIHKERK